MSKHSLIYGFGISDKPGVSCKSKSKVDRAIYSIWFNMIQRCYAEKLREKYPTYKACTVCDEWASLSNFYEWALPRYKHGFDLDKDILSDFGNVYSPEFCAFVPQVINKFLLGSRKRKDGIMNGVYLHKKNGKFISQVSNPVTGEREYLGSFSREIDGHIAWAKRKLEIANQLHTICDNSKIVCSLIKRQKRVLDEAVSCT
jgi:hypothetical protein